VKQQKYKCMYEDEFMIKSRPINRWKCATKIGSAQPKLQTVI